MATDPDNPLQEQMEAFVEGLEATDCVCPPDHMVVICPVHAEQSAWAGLKRDQEAEAAQPPVMETYPDDFQCSCGHPQIPLVIHALPPRPCVPSLR